MTYKITDNDIFEDNPVLKSNEKYNTCTSRELKYVFLTFDYDSPYRKLSLPERKLKALIHAKFKMESNGRRPDRMAREVMNGKVERVQIAIKEFLSTQKDEERELANAINQQLEEIRAFLTRKKETEGEWRIAVSLLEKMPKLLKDRKEVMEILDLRDELSKEADSITDDEPLSELEQMNAEE